MLSVVIVGLSMNILANVAAEEAEFPEQRCGGVMFRETPFSDIKCTNPISDDKHLGVKHFLLQFDEQGRLKSLEYNIDGETEPYYERFIRAPKTTIQYKDNKEIRKFYNEYGQRTVVSGDVYRSVFQLDENGERKSLTFFGVDGEVVENDFGISKYEWEKISASELIEKRYNLEGELVRNRPGFGYFVTRFQFWPNGNLDQMYNLGMDGESITPDEAGVTSTRVIYDQRGNFINWLNIDQNGVPKRGMSDIAEIKYFPSQFTSESAALFFDEDGNLQRTSWGVHKVSISRDKHGNQTLIKYFDENGMPTVRNDGIGAMRYTWTASGKDLISVSYFDHEARPVEGSNSGIHKVQYENDGDAHRQSFHSLNGELVAPTYLGYATELTMFDNKGRVIERLFQDTEGQLVEHASWGYARVAYSYKNLTDLESVVYYDTQGNAVHSAWNPSH